MNEKTHENIAKDSTKKISVLRVANERYLLGAKVGNGSFGVLYEGKDEVTGETVAIKMEKCSTSYPQLPIEYKIYSGLKGSTGVPAARWYGKEGDYNILVMDMLGPSLEDLFVFCNRRFSLKTICMLAIQMVNRNLYFIFRASHLKKIKHKKTVETNRNSPLT
ncbi:hypothetical protein RFI_35290 [Reticulomyxa filosa]|uniref:Casein kinase I n=1 Tax=Reticulomyxa filosa TaxID=46433 RepID=X6LKJ0_RETFI|nr:hypothetical protein RFI_35290 [Reticulomyxa filosa]|eukprot:ETO02144.1 hypothetical protein RFI_35290 [Reticulomyxa filosa]